MLKEPAQAAWQEERSKRSRDFAKAGQIAPSAAETAAEGARLKEDLFKKVELRARPRDPAAT